MKALVKKLQEVPLEVLEGALDFDDKKSTFYQQQRPPAGLSNKKKQAGYAVALADCLSDGIWEEEEEPKKAPKKRASIS